LPILPSALLCFGQLAKRCPAFLGDTRCELAVRHLTDFTRARIKISLLDRIGSILAAASMRMNPASSAGFSDLDKCAWNSLLHDILIGCRFDEPKPKPATGNANAAFSWSVTYTVSWLALGNEQIIGKRAFSIQRG